MSKGRARSTAAKNIAARSTRAATKRMPQPGEIMPMEAQLASSIPTGDDWQYEPKWDGFRCLAFRDGDDVQLMSKAGKPLARYFPEVVDMLRDLPASRFVLDGELVVPMKGRISFDDLLLRIHPAESRIRRLAAETPAMVIVFDLLADERGHSLVARPLRDRRHELERFARKHLSGNEMLHLSPATNSEAVVQRWFDELSDGLDGVIAKRLDLEYLGGQRLGMLKIKRMRTADCVVGGFRYATRGRDAGSLLLGLYDDDGLLHHVGFTSNIPRDERSAVTRRLEALRRPPGFTGRAPGGPSRWSTARSAEWEPLAPRLVVEVQYDHFSGGRFRHGTNLLRWRPDKAPEQCLLAQVVRESQTSLALLGRSTARRSSGSGGGGARRRKASSTTSRQSPPSRTR